MIEFANLNGVLSWFLVVSEVLSIVTILQLVDCDPLTAMATSSLRSYVRYYGFVITNINLQPLIDIALSSYPSALSGSRYL